MSESEKRINVCIGVTEKMSKELEKSAKANNRAKKGEAAARLEHHLKYFGDDWADWTNKL